MERRMKDEPMDLVSMCRDILLTSYTGMIGVYYQHKLLATFPNTAKGRAEAEAFRKEFCAGALAIRKVKPSQEKPD